MKISTIQIKRFRSILNLKLELDSLDHLTTICGANNSGKTNVLRAINIFFNPLDYKSEIDSPNHKFHGTRGGKVFPEITITFKKDDATYKITKSFEKEGEPSIKGIRNVGRQKTNLEESELNSILKNIAFFYVPAINISFPDLINRLIEDIYDLEYEKARFSGLKKDLKESFENYTTGIVDILNNLAHDINPTFQKFNENWEVGFEFVSDVKKFRDLISSDIDFYFNDKSNRNIEAKGSGLQRLGFILMHSRLIKKIKNKTPILLIDEPDIYLHHGLQKKLKSHLEDLCPKTQIILTSHSPVFIDSYKLRNTFLLDLEIGEKTIYKRTNKEFYPLNTNLVDLEKSSGYQKIREYLGIELHEYELLEDYNIMVEGDSDKKYIEEISKFFGIKNANILPTHGVTKFEKFIEFYDSFYKEKENKPYIRLIFDNDEAGRDEYRKLVKKVAQNKFQNIKLTLEFIPNCSGEIPDHNDVIQNMVNTNYEIEDFVYPEILLELGNKILEKKFFNKVSWKSLHTRLRANAHKSKGILYNLDSLKNDSNPDDGHIINFSSEQVKKGLSSSFELKGHKRIANKVLNLDEKYPEVKKYLQKISKK